MSDPSDWRQSIAAEFPNDNPALHGGAIWVCFAPCGPLRPVVRPRSGVRASTIPAPTSEATSITEVTCLALPVDDGAPLPVELAPAPALAVRPPLLDLAEDDATAPEGCSLSAGLEPLPATETEDLRASEMRERPVASAPAHGATPVADAASIAVEQSPVEVRRTILPPPSEETRTLTLTRIHVAGRSHAPASAERGPVAPAESSNDVSVPAQAATESESTRPDSFAAFVAALVEVALAAGATRAAALLPGFIEGAAQDFTGSSDAVRSSLLDSGLAREADGSLVPSVAFVATASAWRMVLRGESNDFSACGTSTLDGWAADVLKSFGVGRDGRVDVKRELRRRGVAAFGMILAA